MHRVDELLFAVPPSGMRTVKETVNGNPQGCAAAESLLNFLLVGLLLSILGCNRGAAPPEPANVHAAEAPASKWFKTEIPLTVHRHEMRDYERASAQGFWQATSTDREKQLMWPIAVKIECDREARVCREADATVQLGLLQPDLVEYEISSWTRAGIVADDSDECNRHSLKSLNLSR